MNLKASFTLEELEQSEIFISRHVGSNSQETEALLQAVGATSLDDLSNQIVPEGIRLKQPIDLDAPQSEQSALAYLKNVANKNKLFKNYIGMGYHPTYVPPVVQRNVLENPGWYTAYTPYQPEIAQGRLEAILNFQQMTLDLTGMDLASASLLDEATAAAEAMAMALRLTKNKSSQLFFIDSLTFPQTIAVLKTRAMYLGIEVVVDSLAYVDQYDVFGALLQYPNSHGDVLDISAAIQSVQSKKGLVAVCADIMALVVLKSPGELGADMVLGSSQRFGVPMGYGGPHAAFFATRDQYKRAMPGRIIGVSVDANGNPALRMAMQTREQHIRREKATSNICTAQVLLAVMASFYAVYHGPKGLKMIANRIHRFTQILQQGLEISGIRSTNTHYFDTLSFDLGASSKEILARAEAASINLRVDANGMLGVSLNETTTRQDIVQLWSVFLGDNHGLCLQEINQTIETQNLQNIPASVLRNTEFLTHPVFNSYHTETEMMRYLKRLENKDLALNHSMIALGSCTMKLNAAAEMMPVTWPEFANMHPFAPSSQAEGYQQMIQELQTMLIKITGYDAVSMQPNSGAQGEYSGLLAIRRYLDANGGADRNVCLIPSSAHGTNPASAALAGMKVMVVACDEQGNVNMDDLKAKTQAVSDQLACLMVTYPSTHGVYEEGIREICDIVHQHGGQVYMDGANMNAQVGVTQPGFIGSDVSHLNLHKTFSVPHGGGGPGMGPIGVKAHLAPYLPGHPLIAPDERSDQSGAVSAAPFGSAGILAISWTYIAMTGAKGQKMATQYALLNANYIATRLGKHYPLLFSGRNGRVAHECILDLRPIKARTGITEVDIAKRLNDYGFHAPTMSFPVPGTFMIEPTESESKVELDRFIDAMISIKVEIDRVESGEWHAIDNPLKNAPHTQQVVTAENWAHEYSRERAAFPCAAVKANKFWPSVGRVDDVYGDRNLICTCPPIESCQN